MLFSRNDLAIAEREILKTLDFELGIPLAFEFLHGFGILMNISSKVIILADKILQFTLNDIRMTITKESFKAAACLFIAARMLNTAEDNLIINKYIHLLPTHFGDVITNVNELVLQYSYALKDESTYTLLTNAELLEGISLMKGKK